MKTPVEIADDVLDSEEFANLTIDDLGHARYDIAIAVIKADRAQRPQWIIWNDQDPGDSFTVWCSERDAEDIADAFSHYSGTVLTYTAHRAEGIK